MGRSVDLDGREPADVPGHPRPGHRDRRRGQPARARSTSPACGARSTSACSTPTARRRPGDWVLIHVGFALSKVDEEEAQATLALLQGMGADYEQELEELKASVIE